MGDPARAKVIERWTASRIASWDRRAERLGRERYAGGFEARAVCILIARYGATGAADLMRVRRKDLTAFVCQWRSTREATMTTRMRLQAAIASGGLA